MEKKELLEKKAGELGALEFQNFEELEKRVKNLGLDLEKELNLAEEILEKYGWTKEERSKPYFRGVFTKYWSQREWEIKYHQYKK